MGGNRNTISIMLAIVTSILVVTALKFTPAITMPLAFAFFIVVLVHPLQRWLDNYLPRWGSVVVVLLVLAGFLGIAIAALSVSGEIIEPKLPEYRDKLQQMLETGRSWAQQRGLPILQQPLQSLGSPRQITDRAVGGIKSLLSALSLFILVIALITLLLLEVGQFREKTKQGFPDSASEKLIKALATMSHKLRRYLLVISFTSMLTGILTAVWCLIIGVDLAFVWGLVSFVLNYVPTIGSILAVIPPTLLALIFQDVGSAIATLIGLAIIQVVIGSFVDPRLQGSSLKLSPFVTLISIVFWGWVWGIPGALLGVPMTVSIIVLCGEFEATKGISILLGEVEDKKRS